MQEYHACKSLSHEYKTTYKFPKQEQIKQILDHIEQISDASLQIWFKFCCWTHSIYKVLCPDILPPCVHGFQLQNSFVQEMILMLQLSDMLRPIHADSQFFFVWKKRKWQS